MIELKTGEVYTAARARSGESEKGPWQFVTVKEISKSGKEGRKEILIWVENKPVPSEAGGKFRIKTLRSVKFASRKGNDGEWHEEVNVSADIEAVMSVSDAVTSGIDVYPPASTTFAEMTDEDELPF